MPVFIDILENKVLGREFKKGLAKGQKEGRKQGQKQGLKQGSLTVLRRQLEKRFGPIPVWAAQNLEGRSMVELEDLSVRILDASSLEDLLK